MSEANYYFVLPELPGHLHHISPGVKLGFSMWGGSDPEGQISQIFRGLCSK